MAVLALYAYREVSRDVLVIDPITVPKTLEEAGLTGQVMANRIGDALRKTESETRTQIKKDKFVSIAELPEAPDIEIPGTKVGLKTVLDSARTLFGIDKHVSGGIVFAVATPPNNLRSAANHEAVLTIYLTRGGEKSMPTNTVLDADDIDHLVQQAAASILEQVNPYVYAVYLHDHEESEKPIKIVSQIVEDPTQDKAHKVAALNLWGMLLYDSGKIDEGASRFQKAIDIDRSNSLNYYNWGRSLQNHFQYDKAEQMYKSAIRLNKHDAASYSNWASLLVNKGNFHEAYEKYRKAIELDPKNAIPYNGYGFALENDRSLGNDRHRKAIEQYKLAVKLDPNLAIAHVNLGYALEKEEKHDDAASEYHQAILLDSRNADPYYGLGLILQKTKNTKGALSAYSDAIALRPDYADAYYNRAKLEEADQVSSAIADYQKYLDLGAGEREGDASEVKSLISSLRK